MVLLSIENLSKNFPINKIGIDSSKSTVTALSNITFQIYRGETLALVGESGSGKTTLARCILRFISADKGKIIYQDKNILEISNKEFRALQPKFQMIFQSPVLALDPRKTVGSTLEKPLKIINKITGDPLQKRISQLLELVGLENDLISRYPHQLSGGQQQRIVIARALATEPEFIIADEPTSSIDAIHKKQIIQLLKKLQKELGLTLLFISHDIDLVADISDRIAVLYKGFLVELGRTDLIIKSPAHPYTQNLIEFSQLKVLSSYSFSNKSTHKSSLNNGCVFKEECTFVQKECHNVTPDRNQISNDHSVTCHFPYKYEFDELELIEN